ncbi:MAG: NADH-quinone oxidoreductase subunit C, partial [Sphingomonadales bacterium]
MAHAAPLVAPQPALAAALTKLLGADLLAHIFTVDEDSITVDREAVAGV